MVAEAAIRCAGAASVWLHTADEGNVAMTCIRTQNGIMCVPDSFVSLEPYGAKVWCEYHSYTGPAFFRSERAIKEIEHPSRKTWDAYYKWRESFKK